VEALNTGGIKGASFTVQQQQQQQQILNKLQLESNERRAESQSH